jgi:5-methylcytosine-specific restriction endonuclease McrA
MSMSTLQRRRYVMQILAGREHVECHYCGQRLSHCLQLTYPRMTLDHVQPLSLGGARGLSNIVPACWRCNQARSNTNYYVFVNRIMRRLVRWARP